MKTITPATGLPVTLASIQSYLRVSAAKDADLLEQILIPSAVAHWERYTHRALMERTLEAEIRWRQRDAWRRRRIKFPRPPLQSVESVKLLDQDDAEQDVPAAAWRVNTHDEPGELVPADIDEWPPAYSRRWQEGLPYENQYRLRIRWVAGYATVDEIPADYLQQVRRIVATFYEHREDVGEGHQLQAVPAPLAHMLDLHTIDADDRDMLT